MEKVTAKRVFAYVIDYILVALIASLFARVPILNPNYDKYIEEYNNYMDSLSEKMEGNINNEALIDSSYNIAKLGINISIINVVVGVVYFMGFQYINKGQTIGKKLFKIKMVNSEDNERPKFYQVAIHSAIINSLLTSLILIIVIAYFSKAVYLRTNEIVQFLDLGLVLGSFGFMIMRKDGLGIHNLIAKTNVIKEVKDENRNS